MDKIFTPIKGRIIQFIENQRIKKDNFFTLTGISASNFKGNGAKSEIGGEALVKILTSYPSLSPEWLLTGEGDMLKPSTHAVAEPQAVYRSRTDRDVDAQRIPLYSIEAAAGIVQLFQDTKATKATKDFIMVPNLPKCDGAVPISGDSMYPLLKSGDIVMYKQVHDIANYTYIWGQMYLINFVTDGEDYTTVKYIQKSPNKDMIVLVSQNENHQSIEIEKTRIRALALIKGSIRINTMN